MCAKRDAELERAVQQPALCWMLLDVMTRTRCTVSRVNYCLLPLLPSEHQSCTKIAQSVWKSHL